MTRVAHTIDELRLWKHQREAVRVAEKYLGGTIDTHRAALFRMPTGTGKTGIMATVVNYLSQARPALIVTPSRLLTGQIERHLNQQFWVHVKSQPPGGPQPAKAFVPSTLKAVLEEEASVYVCTTNTLQMLHDESKNSGEHVEWIEAFVALRERVKLVIVDEGHREPAKEWAEAVRSMERPTLLFSATPYRNDFRFFQIGSEEDYFYVYPFHEAVKDRIIRNVVFVSPPSSFGSDEKAFASALLDFYKHDAYFHAQTADDEKKPKVIIRCDDVTSIRNVMDALASEAGADDVIGIHDEFVEQGQYFNQVPHGHEATFWVHQFKLTEGLDDPSFRMVAFFQPFGNARSLVQQAGRVLRNPDKRRNQVAFIFSDPADGLENRWRGYVEFEKSEEEILSPEEILRRFVRSLPPWFYFDREYRRAAHVIRGEETDTEREEIEASLRDDLRLALTAEVLRVPENFDEEAFTKLVKETVAIYESEELMQAFPPYYDREGNRAVMLSWRVAQSPSLDAGGFFEVSLRPAVFYRQGSYLFHQGPVSVRDAIEETALVLVDPSELERVLDDQENVTQLSLINCDLGNASVRRRSMGARSMSQVAPGLGDHFHFVSSAKGRIGENVRYVSLSRGRVSETVKKLVSLEDYCDWCDVLAASMARTSLKGPPVLLRYAQTVRPPKKVRAKHLLIDLHEFIHDFGLRDRKQLGFDEIYPERLEATACEVRDGGAFACQIGRVMISDGKVLYNRKKKRFDITSQDLNDIFGEKRTDRRRKKSAAAYLSQHASVRIITTDGDLYADRHFYRPRVPLWGRGRMEALGIFRGYAPLKKAVTEKGPPGEAVQGKSWLPTSLFGVIDRGNPLFDLAGWPERPDILICDDMGTEAGDFIAVSTACRRIALIHAKTVTAGMSASDFHILNSQVVKNLEFFNPAGTALPDRRKRWSTLWNNTLPRIRRPKNRDVEWVMQTIAELLRKPDTEREVWAVVGPKLSIETLLKELAGPKMPPYELIQLSYLLQSCNATVSSVGARFRLFAPE
jgi:superfamily II DNA or RNA helicase